MFDKIFHLFYKAKSVTKKYVNICGQISDNIKNTVNVLLLVMRCKSSFEFLWKNTFFPLNFFFLNYLGVNIKHTNVELSFTHRWSLNSDRWQFIKIEIILVELCFENELKFGKNSQYLTISTLWPMRWHFVELKELVVKLIYQNQQQH